MVDDLMGAYGGRLVIAVAGVALALLALVLVLWLVRRRSGPSPFLRGGRNRQPRLQVLDAAAVDARRRIVLVRRDDVEHLVMIGGPTDIVIESGIRPAESDSLSAMPQSLPSRREEARLAPQAAPAALYAPPRRLEAPAEPVAAPLGAAVAMPRVDATASRSRPRAEPVAPAVTAQAAPAVSVPAPGEADTARSRRIEPGEAQPARPDSVREAPVNGAAVAEQAPASPPPVDAPQPAATVSRAPTDLGAASDMLDAARRRVFQSAQTAEPESERENRRDSQTASPASASVSSTPPRTLGSDFDRILEEEMASNLAADRRDKPLAATPSMPRRDAAAPRITGAAPEPSLQAEVARIFGEMSVTRDER